MGKVLSHWKKWKWVLVAQLCPIPCDSMDCSLPGSPVHGILQAKILEWFAMPSFRRSSWPRESNLGLLHCRQILYNLSHQGSALVTLGKYLINIWDFPGGSATDTLLQMQGAWVPSLVRELDPTRCPFTFPPTFCVFTVKHQPVPAGVGWNDAGQSPSGEGLPWWSSG